MSLPHIGIGNGLLGDALLSSVEVVQELNRHWGCTVVCRGPEDQRVPTEDLLGQPIEIRTTDETGVTQLHFSGFIQDVALSYEVWGSYTAKLMAVSDSYVLDVTAHKQYYTEGTLSSLAGIIAGRNRVAIDVNAPTSKALNYVQYGETDFSFLNRIVDDYGAWMRPKQGGVEILADFVSGSKLSWWAVMEGPRWPDRIQGERATGASRHLGIALRSPRHAVEYVREDRAGAAVLRRSRADDGRSASGFAAASGCL